MTCYLDTSVVLRWAVGAPQRYRRFLNWTAAVASELIEVEAARTLHRLRLEGALQDEELAQAHAAVESVLDSLYIVEYNATVKRRAAGAFPTILGALDAIHLSSALLWQEQRKDKNFVLLTHDRQLATGARALGLEVDGV